MKREDCLIVISEALKAASVITKAQLCAYLRVSLDGDCDSCLDEIKSHIESLPDTFSTEQLSIGIDSLSDDENDTEWVQLIKDGANYFLSIDCGIKSTPFTNLVDAVSSAIDSAMCGYPVFDISKA